MERKPGDDDSSLRAIYDFPKCFRHLAQPGDNPRAACNWFHRGYYLFCYLPLTGDRSQYPDHKRKRCIEVGKIRQDLAIIQVIYRDSQSPQIYILRRPSR